MAQKTISALQKITETAANDEITIMDLQTYIAKQDPALHQQIEEIDTEQFTSNIVAFKRTDIEFAIQEACHDVASNPAIHQMFEFIPQLNEEVKMHSDNHSSDQTISNQNVCMYCTKYETVSKASEIEPGDTIRFKRLNGLYKHFATVISVSGIADDESKASVTLVELKKTNSFLPITRMTLNEKELDFSKNTIEKAIYTSMPHSREQIVQRALKLVQMDKESLYDIAHNNCEHNSHHISQNYKISEQSDASFRKLKSVIGLCLKGLCKFGSYILQNISILKVVGPLAVIGAVGLICEEMKKLKHLLKQGIICLGCHDEKYIGLKVALVFSLVSLALSFMTGFHVGTIVTTGIIGFLIPFLVPVVYRRVMPLLQPSYGILKSVVKGSKMVQEGDIITFSYCCLPHEGIVTEIKDTKCSETMVKLTIVHFPYPGLFGKTVKKEELYFDLKKDKVFVIDFSGTTCLSNNEVVKKAQEECGKTNHNTISYRSSHLCRFCKTGVAKIEDLPYKRAESIDDLSPGDVIDFKYYLLSHEAVVVKVEYAEKMICSIVHYNYPGLFNLKKREVVEEQFEFDLSCGDVFVHTYKSENVYHPSEVVKRARSKLGEQNFNTFTNRSSHLAQWCKEK